jgi:predicted transcriptional regulator of viral defense system
VIMRVNINIYPQINTIGKMNAAYHKLKKILRKKGFIRYCDALKEDINPEYLRRLVNSGQLIRIDRGLYGLSTVMGSKDSSIAQAANKHPNGVICLLSALRFHGFSTQLPWQVWMAIENDRRNNRLPRESNISMKFVWFSGKVYSEGIDEHIIDGVKVRIYNPAKTVADCFKYRNKIGLDVALEALKEGRRARKFTADELTKYARIDRVLNVIKPYMEAVF